MFNYLKAIDAIAATIARDWPGGNKVAMPSLPGASSALVALALRELHGKSDLVIVVPGPDEIETVFSDLRTFAPDDFDEALLLYTPENGDDAERDGMRLAASRALFKRNGNGQSRIFIGAASALLAPIPDPTLVENTETILHTGDEVESFDELWKSFIDGGYQRASEVVKKGEIAIRGGLIDIWPPTSPLPARIDFFGDEVEAIRQFDPASQRSAEKLTEIWIPQYSVNRGEGVAPVTKLQEGSLFLFLDHDRSASMTMRPDDEVPTIEAWDFLLGEIAARKPEAEIFAGDPAPQGIPTMPLAVVPPPGLADLCDVSDDIDTRSAARSKLISKLEERADAGTEVRIFIDTAGGIEWLSRELKSDSRIKISLGTLSGGCEWPDIGLVILGQPDVYGVRKRSGRRFAHPSIASRGDRVERGEELHPGDLVVHIDHGIGRYLGNTEIEHNGIRQEVMTIQYADDIKLRIPVSHAHLLSRYIGVAGQRVQLSRIGGRKWKQDCIKAEKAVVDYASKLLEIQAERDAKPGFACELNMPWMDAFEAAFPFQETKDQIKCIEAVKHDLSLHRPMDRLICGDAGYGKTEVAMRAAFAVVMNGRQVAVLAPTTVLAEQHYATFRERMSAFPVRIEVLSRLRSQAERSRILHDLEAGTIDIIIGTHALIQPNVRFKEIGLVVIDEEQRFGVDHKERLKRLRSTVDVLTLSATPIPRTLYMSMIGARDMSLLQTPPQERLAIETHVERDRDDIIRFAAQREINREGQVFFLHNRVITMGILLKRLRTILPEARIAVAHGQMPPGELAATMRRFEAGEYDVLLCTTIIESGLDIPRANTIIIHRADRFGLAELYQLRGRVGRSSKRGYAYLLVPPQGVMDEEARQRIQALQRHGGLSGGLNLALRDLEIRGAGNILGAEQSGHIASVGFGLYCQLLRRTVARLKGEAVPLLVDVDLELDFISLSPGTVGSNDASCIPYDYIDDDALRMNFHRRIAEAVSVGEIRNLRAEMTERFGPIPDEAKRMLRMAELRILAALAGIHRIEAKDGVVRLFQRDGQPYMLKTGRFPRISGKDPDAMLTALFRVVSSIAQK